MAKDPAFLFYSQDFYTGVATLNWEDRGKFISILCLMHQQGRMTEETIRFLVGSISDNLKAKFRIDSKGLWYNERLELESDKRNSFTESRRINGNLGGRPKKQKAIGKPKNNLVHNHMGNHMESVNEDVNENRSIIEKSIFSDQVFMGEMNRLHKGKDLRRGWDECWNHFIQEPVKLADWQWRQKFSAWMIRTKPDQGRGKNWNKVV